MPAQPLTLPEKLIFRNIKRAAIVLLLIIRLDPQPVNETTAAEILAIDKETARKYLKTLQECQIITRLGRFDGYTLTEGGRQLALPYHLEKLMTASAEIPRSENLIKIGNAEIPRSDQPLKEEEEEEGLNMLKQKSSSSSLETENNQKQSILEQTELIFDNAVIAWGIELEINTIENILGWIAEAYDRRNRLGSPPSLVYSRLKDGIPARNRYKLNPGKYLPENYLLAIDRQDLIPRCQVCEQYPCTCKDENEDDDPDETGFKPEEPNPRIYQRWSSEGTMTPARAFEAALGQLQMEMPKAAFDTWLRDAELLDADPETRTFTIGAWTEYAATWIDSRLNSSITRLLTGIMNATIEIKIRKTEFIPANKEGKDADRTD